METQWKGRRGPKPFENYKVYGPTFDKRDGRYRMFLRHVTNGEATTLSLARFRMTVYLGYLLPRDVEVDHVDDDKVNDDLSNLQILSRAENLRKMNAQRGLGMVDLRCPECKREFTRPRRQTFLAKRGRYTTCSRRCSGIFASRLAVNDAEAVAAMQREVHVLREYKIFGLAA